MPELDDEEWQTLLKEISKNSIPVSLNVSKLEEEKALQECDEYIQTGNKNINDMNPLSVYHIISKLPSDKQIQFIKENIKYIKEHDEEIFLYHMLYPQSLSYFLSFDVLKELRNIDADIFKKVISRNSENLFHGFAHEDYYSFYNQFYTDLIEVENREFINGLYFHNRCCHDNAKMNDINNVFQQQRVYNEEFMNFFLDKFNEKINQFNPRQLLSFLKHIENIEVYKEFVNKNYVKLNVAFDNIDEYDLKEYLSETDSSKQEILISIFFENIITKQDLKKIISKINTKIIIDLYSKNKEVFNSLTLNDWIKLCSKTRTINDDFKNILDTFEIVNIEELFDTKFYTSYWHKGDVSALRYIEEKYRNNIIPKGKIEEIDITTSIFNEKYIKNLTEFREMFKNNTISKTNASYKQHLSNFVLFLKNQNIINDIENNNLKEIEKLFYRIVMGESLTVLYKLSSIEDITLLNRLGKIDFKTRDFTVEQLESYNIKLHRSLYKKYEENKCYTRSYKELILKLIFMIGFNNTKKLLEIEDSVSVLEHLVGNVDVKNIKLDEQRNPILNTKLMNLLFNDKDHRKIKEMLSNKDNELYKYFPRIFSEWEMIKINNRDKSLKEVIDFLKSDDVTLPPKYYRLEGLFKFIGCRNSIVNETLLLHDQMLNRVYTTIPRIKGSKDEYSYEVLRLDDIESITVGNKTDCCFTVLGNGYSCLKHALTSHNGRIFVVKKDEELLAHSWIWINGDLLCFDNIEISKKINCVDFFDIYVQAADEFIKETYQVEGIEHCIKNITIGFTDFDKPIKGIEQYPCLIAKTCDLKNKEFENRLGTNKSFIDVLPQPIEEVGYSDSKNVQYLIRGNGMFNLGQSWYNYQDNRNEIMHYSKEKAYEEDYIKIMNKKVNALRYVKAETENTLGSYKAIDVKDLKEGYCNNDWYVISYQDGTIEHFNNSYDPRAEIEINELPLYKNKQNIKIKKPK